jgi:hypothetical protein
LKARRLGYTLKSLQPEEDILSGSIIHLFLQGSAAPHPAAPASPWAHFNTFFCILETIV